jgi:16S rRNA (guanine527-N7)-methyltransferase
VRAQLEEVTGRAVSRETIERLSAFAAFLESESQRQNLIARSTLEHVWDRHILDSAQLVRFEPHSSSSWIDIGSGAGLPGIVIACLVEGSVTLVEPRKLRAEFLHRVAESLALRAEVLCCRAEHVHGQFDVIAARAVAALPRLLEISQHLSTRKSVWVLPKGRTASAELAEVQRAWQGTFHVERSLTDADSAIIVGAGVRAKR